MSDTKTNFMDEYAGAGYDNLSGDMFSTPFIKLLQSNSSEVENQVEGAKVGIFWNVRDKKPLGDTLKVIPINVEVLWLEWEENLGGLKGKYVPGSIPSIGDAFNRKNPKTGRDLVDTWCFYILLAGAEDEGMYMLVLPVTMIKYLKAWNDMIINTKLDSGKRAPFYSSIWTLGPTFLGPPNAKGKRWWTFGGVEGARIVRNDFVSKDVFLGKCLPARKASEEVMLTYNSHLSGPVLESSQDRPLLTNGEDLPPDDAPEQF